MKMYNSTHLFMVPSTSRRIRNYEQVKFTATMNKAIDILRLQIEGKCPSVKFKDIKYDASQPAFLRQWTVSHTLVS